MSKNYADNFQMIYHESIGMKTYYLYK